MAAPAAQRLFRSLLSELSNLSSLDVNGCTSESADILRQIRLIEPPLLFTTWCTGTAHKGVCGCIRTRTTKHSQKFSGGPESIRPVSSAEVHVSSVPKLASVPSVGGPQRLRSDDINDGCLPSVEEISECAQLASVRFSWCCRRFYSA